MSLLVYRNHRIIQHLALWSSRAPFLSSLLAISHQIISFRDYFNFRKDLSLSVQFAPWIHLRDKWIFFSSIRKKFFYGRFRSVNKIVFIRWAGSLYFSRDTTRWTEPYLGAAGILLPREMRKSIESDTSTYHTPHKQSVLPKCQDRSTGGPVRSTKPFKVYCSKPYCKLNILCRVLKEAREK